MNFDIIPQDAIGILARFNDNPLGLLEDTQSYVALDITSLSPDSMVLEHPEVHTMSFATYLGAIVSADRSIVYWVNNTKPLPS